MQSLPHCPGRHCNTIHCAVIYCPIRSQAILGCLLALALALSPLQARANTAEPRLLVLGDSISAAYGMSLEQGWVARLKESLEAEHANIAVINASISGETTQGALRRLPGLLAQHQPTLLIIELGGNDGLRGYPLSKLRDNLTRMVSLAQASGARVILVPMEIPPNYGPRYTSGFRTTFSDIATGTGVTLSPFILDGIATDSTLMQQDGIHPTVAAQELLLANMLPTIRIELNKL